MPRSGGSDQVAAQNVHRSVVDRLEPERLTGAVRLGSIPVVPLVHVDVVHVQETIMHSRAAQAPVGVNCRRGRVLRR